MNMNNTFKELFGSIQADEGLKDRTKAFLEKKTQGYTRVKAAKRRYYPGAAACACFLIMLFGGYGLYFTPVAEISVDINPSIEMGVNRFDRVISVKDFNEDGSELSGAIDVKYRNYTDAIEQILNNDMVTSLLADNEIMTITVIGSDGLRSDKILSGVEACTARQNNTYCYFVPSEEAAKAHEMGLSCGKYRAFLELQLLDPDATPETVQGMTMREIRDLIDSLSTDGDNDVSSVEAASSCNNRRGKGHHGNGCGHKKE